MQILGNRGRWRERKRGLRPDTTNTEWTDTENAGHIFVTRASTSAVKAKNLVGASDAGFRFGTDAITP